MKRTNHSKLVAIAATLGMALALGGTSYAVAQTDIGSRSASVAEVGEAPGNSPVIGKSWTSWYGDTFEYISVPTTTPRYSQVNFLTNRYGTGGPINTAQGAGQMHANATLQLRKATSGEAKVTCDLRIDGAAGATLQVITLSGSDATATIPFAGSQANLPAGQHNAGIRCWAPAGGVQITAYDLHAVVYGASVPS